jgi:heptosyltransferase-1
MNRLKLQEGDGILLIRLGAVGDVVRTMPCLPILRETVPGTRLAWVVEPPSVPLLPGHPWLNEVIVFPRMQFHSGALLLHPVEGVRYLHTFFAQLKAFQPKLAIDFQGSAKSALIGWLSGAPARLGFDRSGAREGSFLLNNIRVAPSSPHLNRIQKNMELLDPLGAIPSPLSFPFFDVKPSDKVREFLEPLETRVRIAVHAGTSRRQRHKQWPADYFARLISCIALEGWAPILTWGPGERALVDTIQDRSDHAGFPTPDLDLQEMRQVIARCRLFVGADTGPMHLAWSQGVPVVALFGSTDPRINGPLGPGHTVIAPAWNGNQPPPRRGDAEPIRRISPESVFQAVRSMLHTGKETKIEAPPR